MKKLFLLFVFMMALVACTENERTRYFGAEQTIYLDRGQKLDEVTWKDDDLWFMTEPMDSDYTPKTKTFYEKQSWNIKSGKVIFIERR